MIIKNGNIHIHFRHSDTGSGIDFQVKEMEYYQENNHYFNFDYCLWDIAGVLVVSGC